MTTTIQPGQRLWCRSIGDSECLFTGEVLGRSASMATIKRGDGEVKRCRVRLYGTVEYVTPWGLYSMHPSLRADSADRPMPAVDRRAVA